MTLKEKAVEALIKGEQTLANGLIIEDAKAVTR